MIEIIKIVLTGTLFLVDGILIYYLIKRYIEVKNDNI